MKSNFIYVKKSDKALVTHFTEIFLDSSLHTYKSLIECSVCVQAISMASDSGFAHSDHHDNRGFLHEHSGSPHFMQALYGFTALMGQYPFISLLPYINKLLF